MTYSEAFEVLGLSSDASIEQVAARFKVLAKKYHPDRHWDADPKRQRFLTKKFAEANTAYEKALEFLASPSAANPGQEMQPANARSASPSANTPPNKSGWRSYSLFAALGLSLIVYGQVETKRGKTQKPESLSQEDEEEIDPALFYPPPKQAGVSPWMAEFLMLNAQSCASNPYGINETTSLAKEALKENDYNLALKILNTRTIQGYDSTLQSRAVGEFLEVRYTANCGLVAAAKQMDAISHGWALYSQGNTLHRAMQHKMRRGSSAGELRALSASFYKQALDVALPTLEADAGNTSAARLAAQALQSLGNLQLEFGRFVRNDEYIQDATDCYARSADLCTQYPTIADVLF